MNDVATRAFYDDGSVVRIVGKGAFGGFAAARAAAWRVTRQLEDRVVVRRRACAIGCGFHAGKLWAAAAMIAKATAVIFAHTCAVVFAWQQRIGRVGTTCGRAPVGRVVTASGLLNGCGALSGPAAPVAVRLRRDGRAATG